MRSAAWSSAAADPGLPSPTGCPSSATAGTTSRIDEDVKISSRLGQVRERKRALAELVPEPRRFLGEREPSHARENPELEGRRVENPVAAPPDVRHRALEHDVASREEDRVVGPATPGLRLGGHVDRVARRLHASQEPRSDRPEIGIQAERKRDERDAAGAVLLERGRERADEDEPGRNAASLAPGCPVDPERAVGRVRTFESLADERLQRGAIELGQPDPGPRAGETIEVGVEAKRRSAVDP